MKKKRVFNSIVVVRIILGIIFISNGRNYRGLQYGVEGSDDVAL